MGDIYIPIGKKRHHPSKQTNFETIKRLIKGKNTRKILPGSHCLIQQDTVAKHQIHMGKQQK
jgi:hypothetical protein